MDEKEKLEAGKQTVQGQDAAPGAAASPEKPASRWRNYLAGRNKDLNLDDDDAVGGYLEDEFGRLDKLDKVNKQMDELILKDKRNAGAFAGLFKNDEEVNEDFLLRDYIIENWWQEIRDAVDAEDAIERINKKMADEEEQAAKDAKRDEDAAAKFEAMGMALNDAAKETGVDEATCKKVVDFLYGTDEEGGLYARIAERNVSKEDFVKLIYAFNRDKSLEDARNEGLRKGKEQRSGAAHRSASVMAQTDLGGGGGSEEKETDENPTAKRYGQMGRRFT